MTINDPKYQMRQKVRCRLPVNGVFALHDCYVNAIHIHIVNNHPAFFSYDLLVHDGTQWQEFSGVRETTIIE